MKDIDKSVEFPLATKDNSGQLLVAAALGTGADTLDRFEALNEIGVDVFVDSALGHSKNVIETIKLLKDNFKDVQVIAGNVATPDGAVALDEVGADAIKMVWVLVHMYHENHCRNGCPTNYSNIINKRYYEKFNNTINS